MKLSNPEGGDLPRRVKRLIGIGGNAGRRLTDDAVLEAQKVTGDQQGQCRQVETEVAGRMTRTVQDTHTAEDAELFTPDEAQVHANRCDLTHLLHAGCRGGALLSGNGGHHSLDALRRDTRPGNRALYNRSIVSVSPDFRAAELERLGQTADVIDVVMRNDDAADRLGSQADLAK